MSQHPVNLALRFFLEIAALAAMGYWGWSQAGGFVRYLLAFGVPLFAATVWAIFRVPGDPSSAPVAVPGMARLLLEATFFAFAAWSLFTSSARPVACTFVVVVLIHYATSMDRLGKLLHQ